MASIVRRRGPTVRLVLGLALTLAGPVAPTGPVAPPAPAGRVGLTGVATGGVPPPGAVIPVPSGPVLPALDPSAAAPTATGVGAALAGVLDAGALGPAVAAQVVDLTDGTVLLDRAADRAAVPASTAKILTAVAVLSLRGPDSTLPTRAVQPGPGQVVLVGGGDVLLGAGAGDPDAVVGHAGLDDLAVTTAARLLAGGQRQVSLTVDDTLFGSQRVAPGWAADVGGGFISPVTALAVDAGNRTPGRRPQPGYPFPRVADPSLAAATVFAQRLRAHGVAVNGAPTRATTAVAASATELGEIRSARLADVVEHALTDSDNAVAESLARLVAVSSNAPPTAAAAGAAVLARLVAVSSNAPPTAAAAGAAVLARLAALGVATDGQQMAGGSGLGTGYALRPATLVAALRLAADPARPDLRATLTGLPVAGGSGTLADRFGAPGLAAARGAVRAKTGTLTGASSLAGVVTDADGRLLAFAVLADRVGATGPARAGLDRVATALAGCGCR